ncbi:phosphate ABC transporter permease PstA [Kyrpidia spormannii]|uniref:Phosphate transporter subunit membrane component of ABC superfamily n=1 Tax=Kyrpidia spormannii TaxID=2055160 RepID=A0ACA8ZF79_9BACL|nr:phosphate ABC transporter permease PstA [Kyrpidia spormannii]CAB3394909.1 phosphate transporter subunit; membrane component of ABC superfamily [Kyrpidia spormannii]
MEPVDPWAGPAVRETPRIQVSADARRQACSRLMTGLSLAATLVLLAVSLIVMGYILLKGVPGLSVHFFTRLPAPVGMSGGGVYHAITGSLVLVGLACAIAVPWGVAVGIFLSEFGRRGRLGQIVRFTADVLSGMPSITAGIFIYTLVVVKMETFSALAGGLALAIVMLPVVARNTEEMLRLVPQGQREATMALGIPYWRTVLWVVLPSAGRGVGIGITLAVAGIAGDPVPLFFTALNNNYFSLDLTQPISSLPMEIFRYAAAPFAAWHRLAWTGALVLIVIIVLPMLLVRLLLPGYRIRR